MVLNTWQFYIFYQVFFAFAVTPQRELCPPPVPAIANSDKPEQALSVPAPHGCSGVAINHEVIQALITLPSSQKQLHRQVACFRLSTRQIVFQASFFAGHKICRDSLPKVPENVHT